MSDTNPPQTGEQTQEVVTTTDEVHENPDGSVTETETQSDVVTETPEYSDQAEGSTSAVAAEPATDTSAPEAVPAPAEEPVASPVDDQKPETD